MNRERDLSQMVLSMTVAEAVTAIAYLIGSKRLADPVDVVIFFLVMHQVITYIIWGLLIAWERRRNVLSVQADQGERDNRKTG